MVFASEHGPHTGSLLKRCVVHPVQCAGGVRQGWRRPADVHAHRHGHLLRDPGHPGGPPREAAADAEGAQTRCRVLYFRVILSNSIILSSMTGRAHVPSTCPITLLDNVWTKHASIIVAAALVAGGVCVPRSLRNQGSPGACAEPIGAVLGRVALSGPAY